ncbi:interferon-inducible GTPase 1-like [Dendronephthya gigantea]|uniref:interferon-inducible GTPase 1-like n=1 Tax=Dendronephthya gigantea TaxID=151771 RepID=UPI00106B5718|nr:interferon-inducible GTPase 1-like [Dendronephthya gigantea]
MKEKLENFRDVQIKIGVTGTTKVGKSSFINAFRGIDDNDEQAAKTGIFEKKNEPAFYPYPDEPRIILVDLPAIKEKIYSDEFKSCDSFLILTETRFRAEELEIARKIKSMEKSFLLVRTKVDLDEENEAKRKNRDINDVLAEVRDNYFQNLKALGIREGEIFLVSSHYKDRWDFRLLVDVIMKNLPTLQKAAKTWPVKFKSKNIIRKKVEIFRGRLWKVKLTFISLFLPDIIACGLISHSISKCQIKKKIKLYRSQLGLPEDDSEEFRKMKKEFITKIREFYTIQKEKCTCCICCAWKHTIGSLNQILTDMENISLKMLDEAAIGIEQSSEEKSNVE